MLQGVHVASLYTWLKGVVGMAGGGADPLHFPPAATESLAFVLSVPPAFISCGWRREGIGSSMCHSSFLFFLLPPGPYVLPWPPLPPPTAFLASLLPSPPGYCGGMYEVGEQGRDQ